jgi:penicillin-binding protein 1A
MLLISPKFRENYLKIESDLISNLQSKENLPDSLFKAIIVIEDKRFYSHLGVDFYSILRAFRNNTIKKRKEGASTISQQLVRVITNKREITYSRKITEILLSLIINTKLTKKQIITGYCWLYQFEKSLGIESLCQIENYTLKNLTHNESCQIAARFKYPSLRKSNYNNYLKRVRTIEIKTTPNTVHN